jgi:hypothetical protein
MIRSKTECSDTLRLVWQVTDQFVGLQQDGWLAKPDGSPTSGTTALQNPKV